MSEIISDEQVREAVCKRYKELTGDDLSPHAVDMTLAEPMLKAQARSSDREWIEGIEFLAEVIPENPDPDAIYLSPSIWQALKQKVKER